jgi:hypothetical protein
VSKRDTRPTSHRERIGILDSVTLQIKLILRLMGDSRINPLIKLLPVGALIYLVVPDVVLGPIDDAFIVWIGTSLFVELCPPDIVREHREALASVVEGDWRVVDEDETRKFDSSSGSDG